MKYKIYSFLILLIIVSCKENSEDILKETTENWIEKNTNNPKSDEFIEFNIIDTLNLNEKNDKVYLSIQNDIKNYEKGLEDIEIGLKYLDRGISEGKADIADIKEGENVRMIAAQAQTKLDSLIKRAETHKQKYFDQEIYRVRHKFRINNSYNAPMLNSYLFVIDSKHEVIDALKDN